MIPTRTTDQAFSALFSVSRPFSEHLTKREDDQLRDKYDHNAFFYEVQPSVKKSGKHWPTKKRGEMPSLNWRVIRRWNSLLGWKGKKR